ncbi:hypothetical protein NDU88_009469 [Pleurodeles waltl]|uniref:Uncharacterized protein n=1 Tax=Pleurodeles waltl TaxID=8319 RepID=A0AAV7QXL7_PLEWA|nr:hypothetical protein NDU88_009469 [Pleurodeles waltl]
MLESVECCAKFGRRHTRFRATCAGEDPGLWSCWWQLRPSYRDARLLHVFFEASAPRGLIRAGFCLPEPQGTKARRTRPLPVSGGAGVRTPATTTSHGGQQEYKPASAGIGGRGAVPRRASLAMAPPPWKAGRGRAPASGAVLGAGAPTSWTPDQARFRNPEPTLGGGPRLQAASEQAAAEDPAAQWTGHSLQSSRVIHHAAAAASAGIDKNINDLKMETSTQGSAINGPGIKCKTKITVISKN